MLSVGTVPSLRKWRSHATEKPEAPGVTAQVGQRKTNEQQGKHKSSSSYHSLAYLDDSYGPKVLRQQLLVCSRRQVCNVHSRCGRRAPSAEGHGCCPLAGAAQLGRIGPYAMPSVSQQNGGSGVNFRMTLELLL